MGFYFLWFVIGLLIGMFVTWVIKSRNDSNELDFYGYQRVVKNRNRQFGELKENIHVEMVDENNDVKDYLFTENELKVSHKRAMENKDDFS